jgi:acyl-CoA synthetase (AMP-forming)/AMP-acid ligase II
LTRKEVPPPGRNRAEGVSLSDNYLRRATIGDMLRRRARRDAGKPALIGYAVGGRRTELSYRDLNSHVNRVAQALSEQGIERGDVVAVMARNVIEFVLAYYATLKLGGVFTALNPLLTPREIALQIDHAEPSLLLIEQDLMEQHVVTLAASNARPMTIRHSDSAGVTQGSSLTELADMASSEEPNALVDESDLALIVYTSGTESLPKGVMLSHRNFLIATTPGWAMERYVETADVFLILAPLYTMAGLGTLTNLLTMGATVVLMEQVKPQLMLEVVQAERVTNTSQTPTFYLQLVGSEEFKRADLSSLRQCHTYGGPIPAAVIDAFAKRVPHLVWATYWGQTELSQLGSIGFYRGVDEIPQGDLQWIGKPVPYVEVRVVNEDGDDRELGELICRSPGVMVGYHKDGELTARVTRDGWLHTGDIVRIDNNHNLFFVDRMKDVVKTGGMNVSSQEVEGVLLEHPAVAEAAVVGVKDPYWSEAVVAFVVLKEGRAASVEEVMELCRIKLASYKVPKRMEFVEGLPRDGQGKVVKRELRRRIEAG